MYCSKCKKTIVKGMVYCPGCGAKLVWKNKSSENTLIGKPKDISDTNKTKQLAGRNKESMINNIDVEIP